MEFTGFLSPALLLFAIVAGTITIHLVAQGPSLEAIFYFTCSHSPNPVHWHILLLLPPERFLNLLSPRRHPGLSHPPLPVGCRNSCLMGPASPRPLTRSKGILSHSPFQSPPVTSHCAENPNTLKAPPPYDGATSALVLSLGAPMAPWSL